MEKTCSTFDSACALPDNVIRPVLVSHVCLVYPLRSPRIQSRPRKQWKTVLLRSIHIFNAVLWSQCLNVFRFFTQTMLRMLNGTSIWTNPFLADAITKVSSITMLTCLADWSLKISQEKYNNNEEQVKVFWLDHTLWWQMTCVVITHPQDGSQQSSRHVISWGWPPLSARKTRCSDPSLESASILSFYPEIQKTKPYWLKPCLFLLIGPVLLSGRPHHITSPLAMDKWVEVTLCTMLHNRQGSPAATWWPRC